MPILLAHFVRTVEIWSDHVNERLDTTVTQVAQVQHGNRCHKVTFHFQLLFSANRLMNNNDDTLYLKIREFAPTPTSDYNKLQNCDNAKKPEADYKRYR